METMRGTIPAQSTSVAGPGRAVAAGLVLVAALSGGFAFGRVTAPAIQGSARPQTAVHQARGGADIPTIIRPTRHGGTVKRGWGSTRGFDVAIRPGHHHSVKWG